LPRDCAARRSGSDRVGKRSAWLDSPEFECFLAKLIHSSDVPSMARLIVVTLDEAPVAAIIVSVGNPWASAIFAGYDPYYGLREAVAASPDAGDAGSTLAPAMRVRTPAALGENAARD